MQMLVDGNIAGGQGVSESNVIDNLLAGEHTILLRGSYVRGICNTADERQHMYCTDTDNNVVLNVTVTEIPN